MTIWQILSVFVLGPVGLILVGRLVQAILGHNRKGFSLIEGFLLVACAILIAISFIGIQV